MAVAKNTKSAVEDKLYIRAVSPLDAEKLSEIYNTYVLNECVSYEYDAVSIEDFRARILNYTKQYPYLVAMKNDEVIGYAYASSFHPRRAFHWDCEVSLYLDKNARGLGIGTVLMQKILEILNKCNYVNVYSYINFPNEASIALHEKFGFKECGFFKGTGFKFGEWRDLICLEKKLVNEDVPKELEFDWQKYL